MTVLHQVTVGYTDTTWPSDLSTFPNLPPSAQGWLFDMIRDAAESARQGADFEAEERAKFEKLQKEAEDAASDALEPGSRRETRLENKADRQEARATKLSDKIEAAGKAVEAAAMEQAEAYWRGSY